MTCHWLKSAHLIHRISSFMREERVRIAVLISLLIVTLNFVTLIIVGTTDVSSRHIYSLLYFILYAIIPLILFFLFTGVPSPEIIGTCGSSPRSSLSEPERKRLKHQVLTREQEEFLDEWSSQPQSDADEAIYQQERRRLFGDEATAEADASEGESEAESEPISEIDSETGEGIQSESISERETKIPEGILVRQGQQGKGDKLQESSKTNKKTDGSLPETSI